MLMARFTGVFLLVLAASLAQAMVPLSGEIEQRLGELALGESLVVEGLPLGADRYGAVRLERIAHYAPGAEVRVVEAGELRVLDRSGQLFLAGHALNGEARLALMRDGDSGQWLGAVYGSAGLQDLRSYPGEHGVRLLALPSDSLLPDGVTIESSCANDDHAELRGFGGAATETPVPAAIRGSALRLGTLALDTDKEWLQRRFNNNATTAATWFEQLMLVSNTIFERDVNLRMQQGHTVLRVGSDPYTAGGSSVSLERLQEFGTYWFNNFASVERTHAALVSGRSGSGNAAGGIAWVNTFCRNQSQGGSYSLNQLFYNSSIPVASSVRVFAHEVGHNLGSSHTHCYNPPVDQCFNNESGCYSGPVSCPAAGTGTLISYCNFPAPSGAACGQNRLELAPQVASRIDSRILANFPNCIVSEDQGIIFQDRFE